MMSLTALSMVAESKRKHPEQKPLGVGESRDRGSSCSLSSPGRGRHVVVNTAGTFLLW